MSKKIAIGIVLVVAVAGGAWMLERNNDTASDQSSDPATPFLPYGSNQDAAQTAPTNPQTDRSATATSSAAVVKEFTVTGQNYLFAPATLAVKKGDTVKIIFKNIDGFHDFKIDELSIATKSIRTGEEDSITFVADKIGSFEYYCSIGSHRQMGMKGTLTVTE